VDRPADPLDPVQLLADLAGATLAAHTREAVRQGAAEVLLRWVPLRELQLADTLAGLSGIAPTAIGAALGGETQRIRQGRGELLLLPLDPGSAPTAWAALRLTRSGVLPPVLHAPIAQVLSAALAHVQVVERLARLSRRAHRRTQELGEQLADREAGTQLVARSPAMIDAVAAADLVARHTTPVLLRGESGTGKEVLARRIHQRSRRVRQPFVAVNCGALPAGLVESELFGHEAGAFSGAHRRHAGLFERASGGTLLLDEVGELPLPAQVKLLRVLQQGELQRVGGEQPVPVDVRVIAATHRPLEQMVKEGSFRADLYYRLEVFPISLPPLRDRLPDLAPLATALVERIARRLGRSPLPPSAGLLRHLQGQPWPGNVRELENLLERALIVAPAGATELEVSGAATGRRRAASGSGAALGPEGFDDAVRAHLRRVLDAAGGRIYGQGGAAERLGLRPTTLQSKLRRLGLSSGGRR
jgi:transcriptional regulator with GAF, ATPase, and Fis domain